MAVRWYAMPLDEVGNGRGPKYLRWRFNSTGLDVPWGAQDYGLMPVCICWADVNNGQHNQLTSNNDVRFITLHSDLDNNLTGQQVVAVRDALEFLNIPGQWVDATDTWRQVLRITIGVFQFSQRMHGKFNAKAIPDGYTLATQFGDLPQNARNLLLSTADELGIDYSGATNQTTLRQILKTFGDAWANNSINLNGVEI